MGNTKKRTRNTSSSDTRVPQNLQDDRRSWSLVKLAIRKGWQWSKEWKGFIDRANYTCDNCGTKFTNKTNLYIEHLQPLEMLGINTAEQYWMAMRDPTNIAVWGKCCKAAKDKADRARIRAHKRRLK